MSRKSLIFFGFVPLLLTGLVIGLSRGVVAAASAPGSLSQAETALSVQTTPTPATTEASTLQAEVVVAALNVREGPGVNYQVVDVAHAGDKFKVVGTNAARTWVQIGRADGSLAWISAWQDYTRLSGLLDSVPVVQAPLASVVPAGGTAPSITPGSGKLVFMNTSGGDIYLINADGSNLRLLTKDGLDPALSPNGQQVAFARWGPTEGVYLINVDGSNERQVHPAHQPKSPVWSPDGTQLIFNMQRGGRLEEVRECKTSSDKDNPNLPPDAFDVGRKTIIKDQKYEFCYRLPPRPWWQLRKLDLATGQFQDLPSDTGSFGPAWDPRNTWRVVYSGDVSLVQLDLNQNTRLSLVDGTSDHTPAFSPDGIRLAVAHKQPNDQWSIDTINMDTGERTQLATEGSNISPAWSPDGSQIAFLSNRGGPWNIWVMNSDGSNQRPMFAPGTLSGINFEFHEVDERMISWRR